MTDGRDDRRTKSVPRGRVSRLAQFGRIAGGVAGGMMAEAARRLADGEQPRLRDMMLTPANVARVADRLSHLRGAAMKLGQMISMDSGDFLPAELSEIMSRLRENAHQMPPAQLQQILTQEWGRDWRTRFKYFEPRPIAAASIGQVHRATMHDGRVLAIKVQYPGVRDSIDADVDNVAALLRISRLLPDALAIAPLLKEAKRQLHEEADYVREGTQMEQFKMLLASTPTLIVPTLEPALTTENVLAMSFVEGIPIEELATRDQTVRDGAMRALIALVIRELFEFGLMQTDPNFANYRFQPETGRLLLLDFGAVRLIDRPTAYGYRRLIHAGLANDHEAVRGAALAAGFFGADAVLRHRSRIDSMIDIILGELHRAGPFDFGDRRFVALLRDQAADIMADRSAWHLPPAELLFVQRKISGTALLAARLKARVNIRELLEGL